MLLLVIKVRIGEYTEISEYYGYRTLFNYISCLDRISDINIPM